MTGLVNESSLVLSYKKELLFEKRSKNFHSVCVSWGCSSVGEHLLCKQGVVGSIPSTSIGGDVVAVGYADRMSIERSL